MSNKYYQYGIYVEGELKWFFGTTKNINKKDIVVRKAKSLDVLPTMLGVNNRYEMQ